MPVAGGVSKAVDRAALHGCEALPIFSKNASLKTPAILFGWVLERFPQLVANRSMRLGPWTWRGQ